MLGKKKFNPKTRVLVIPASRDEYLKALENGLIERFVRAGALVEAPCCGPCMGGSFGLLAPGEVSLSTSNRNFRGRQGSTEASVYLLLCGNRSGERGERRDHRSAGGVTMPSKKT